MRRVRLCVRVFVRVFVCVIRRGRWTFACSGSCCWSNLVRSPCCVLLCFPSQSLPSRETQQRRLIYLARLIDLHAGTLMQFNEIYGNSMFNVNQRGRFLADFYVRCVGR
jgi:hypothetical protein